MDVRPMATGGTLYLHIGLPKTATTYLQNALFPRLRNLLYLGMPQSEKFSDVQDREHGCRILVCSLQRSALIWREFGDEIFREMLGDKDARRASRQDVLISEEGVGRAGSRPLFLRCHLEELSLKAADWGFASLKIICVFRRQDHWLGSHYAQVSDRTPQASQKHFEENIDRVLDPYHSRYKFGMLLDYKILRDQIVSAVGEANVLMLPYELLVAEPAIFLQTILSFLGAEADLVRSVVDERAAGDGKHNVRSQGQNKWLLRRRGRTVHLRPHRLFTTVGLPASVSLPKPRLGRGKVIELTPAITEKVLAAYSQSNRRLAEDLPFDLRRYGYY